MHTKHFLLPVVSLFLACDNTTVPKADYDALVAEKQELVAENDSLHFELSDLKMYVDHLEEENAELIEELRQTPVE